MDSQSWEPLSPKQYFQSRCRNCTDLEWSLVIHFERRWRKKWPTKADPKGRKYHLWAVDHHLHQGTQTGRRLVIQHRERSLNTDGNPQAVQTEPQSTRTLGSQPRLLTRTTFKNTPKSCPDQLYQDLGGLAGAHHFLKQWLSPLTWSDLPGPTAWSLIQAGLGRGVWEHAVPTDSLVMLVLLAQGSHFENHCFLSSPADSDQCSQDWGLLYRRARSGQGVQGRNYWSSATNLGLANDKPLRFFKPQLAPGL